MADISPSSIINSIHVVPMLQRKIEMTVPAPRQVYTVANPHAAYGYQLQDYMTVQPTTQAPYTSTEYSTRLWIC
jgi:hypothetical protein